MEPAKYYTSLLDAETAREYERLYIHGPDPGLETGIQSLKDKLRFRKKTTLFLYGPPTAGKSTFGMFCFLMMAMNHDWKFAIFSPETGEPADIYKELTEMLIGSEFNKGRFGMNEHDKKTAMMWLADRFFVIEGATTISECYDACDQIEEAFDIKLDCLSVDPWNELIHAFTDRQDVYLEREFGHFRENAKNHDRLNVIITHPAKTQKEKQDDVWYFPPTMKEELSGGQAWPRKGMNMVSVWRPPAGMNDENGEPYAEGIVLIDIQKVKPKEVGSVSQAFVFYDWRKRQYYEVINGQKIYPLTWRKSN